MHYLRKVEEFHKTFKSPVLDTPQLAPADRAKLRISLIREEFEELELAIDKGDLVEVADALCDLQYVLSGTVLEFGMKDRFDEMFDEVHRSNMSKACRTEEEAQATVKHYEAKGIPCFYEKEGRVYLVFRESDRKTLKSVGYSPASLALLLKPQCPECFEIITDEEAKVFSGFCENCHNTFEEDDY